MSQPASKGEKKPSFVTHESFSGKKAEGLYGPRTASTGDFAGAHMPDEVTRDLTGRMHYAAWRASQARDERSRAFWRSAYLSFRDRVVLGNRKLIYRAVRRWSPPATQADDMAGDCHVVLIQAVAAYNPWIGVRFSTYAFTCLMRALSRLSQKQQGDRLARSLPLESLPGGEPRDGMVEEAPVPGAARIDEYMREGHGLLSHREKQVLARRFRMDESARPGTLEQVGKELGLSKERVRQVQANALGKLRAALGEG